MFSFLKRRVVVSGVGFLLLAAFIWYAGPYFAFADYRPLETVTARLIAIALVAVVWIVSALLKRLRAYRASDKLVAAVITQAHSGPERPTAEALQLREKFEDAAATLKQKRRGGHTLYELPWYVIIGAPGSGKTTALVNSGLHFPLEQRSGRSALRGVGGTRNCDWWFTDEAVFLDTAGRYTTQDSDAGADSAGWSEFLALLRKYRKRRPVNGVILTISAADLMTQNQGAREAHVAAARRRLNELNKELKIQVPVYLMVTKCDLIAGFTEYFDDLPQDGRAQVWGMTFPYDQTAKGEAAEGVSVGVRCARRPPQRPPVRAPGRGARPAPRHEGIRLPAADGGAARRARPVRRRRLRVHALRPARAAARHLFHQRHAGRNADRSAARRHRPPFRGVA